MPKYTAIESTLSDEARTEFKKSAPLVLAFLKLSFGQREFSAAEAKELIERDSTALTAVTACCSSCYGARGQQQAAVPSVLLLLQDWGPGEPILRLSAIRENKFWWKMDSPQQVAHA